jgi:hypothetical protein
MGHFCECGKVKDEILTAVFVSQILSLPLGFLKITNEVFTYRPSFHLGEHAVSITMHHFSPKLCGKYVLIVAYNEPQAIRCFA